MAEIFYCFECGEVEIPEPVGCCSGRDCGCMGMPIDPPYCDECFDKLMSKRTTENVEPKIQQPTNQGVSFEEQNDSH